MRLTAAEIADATEGEIVAGTPDAVAQSFTIDSRTLEPGACFVALVAERDGHDFVPDAFGRGATVAIVARTVDLGEGGESRALIRVADPLVALGALGRLARDRLSGATVVGITGSAGKTATKDLVAAAVSRTRRVTASPLSFNNEAGLPLTLLGADVDTEVVVAEMGARFPGNIADLCAIARPRVGVITNIGLAHAGLLGGRAGVTAVKGELLEALPPNGVAILDAGDEHTPDLARRTSARVVRVGLGAGATSDPKAIDVRATNVALDEELRPSFQLATPEGSVAVRLRVRGEHQVLNAAMAAAVALEVGVPLDEIAAGLAQAESAPWRMDLTQTPSGVAILNDAYNASPTSVTAALRALARLPVTGRRMAVLGEMRELGAEADSAHADIGRIAVECGVDVMVVVGVEARPVGSGARAVAHGSVEVIEVRDAAAALAAVAQRAEPGDAVLIKASRAVGLERVAEALAEERAFA
ncbi:MAG: UDP-N-acetylmuramoyl-tripeptide--D-alanyl-D-alanine ligase [Actinomycetota bacterium]